MTLRAVITTALLVPLFSLSVHATTPGAEEVVRTTSDMVLQKLLQEKAELTEHPERLYGMVNQLIVPHFDFSSMSKWVLGKNWRQASPEQRQQFVEQFKNLLVRTYAKTLLEYSDEKITYLPLESNANSNLVVVKTEIKQPSGAGTLPIHYRMHISGGEWKVVDVAVDGVSLVSTYRGSFGSEIRKNGLDALIAKLAERNDKLESNIE